MRRYGGLIAGVALLLLAVALGWIFQDVLVSPELRDIQHGVVRSDAELKMAISALVVLVGVAPSLVALVMLWIAFVRVVVRDRYLWSAVTIISSLNVAELLRFLIPDTAGHWPALAGSYFISEPTASGIIAYAALFLAITRDSRNPSLGIIPLIAMLIVLVLPIPAGYVSWSTMICTVCATCGMWAISVWIASSVGFDVYASEAEQFSDAI